MKFIGEHPHGPTVINTYTGKWMDIAHPKAESIDFRDIAHALSNICRFVGHTSRFYSVAEHSIHCHDVAVSLVGCRCPVTAAVLLHDAAEAYMHDLCRAVKYQKEMVGYRVQLDALQELIERTASEDIANAKIAHRSFIKFVDNGLLELEASRLFSRTKGASWNWNGQLPAKVSWLSWWWYNLPGNAERGFLARLRTYGII